MKREENRIWITAILTIIGALLLFASAAYTGIAASKVGDIVMVTLCGVIVAATPAIIALLIRGITKGG